MPFDNSCSVPFKVGIIQGFPGKGYVSNDLDYHMCIMLKWKLPVLSLLPELCVGESILGKPTPMQRSTDFMYWNSE